MTVQRRGDDSRNWTLYGGNGSIEVEWYFRQSTRLGASVMLYHLEPGVEEGMHYHSDDPGSCSPRSSEEIYVVTKGEIELIIDDERHVLREGDGAYAPSGVPHGVVNSSDQPAELVLIFGPPQPAEPGS